ncbi:SNX27 [Cordylochernes scorpioides]|uniref:SNX27 n=1 Tax=Cordylochernes scorpioides TaxID=51811 RepID=A0ABY6KTV6_9ARAC|nr:SNX27 [Cordylochernes scorpioides]
MAGRHLCSRRYREFSTLHNNLKKEFPDFNFPKLPGKWPFTLSDQQLDARRRGLEQYLEKVCAIRVIAENDVMQEFLTDVDDNGGSSVPVDLKVLLPDRTTVVVNVRKNSTTEEVYQAVLAKIDMSPKVAKCFALFEIVEYGFGECDAGKCDVQSVSCRPGSSPTTSTFRTTPLPPPPVCWSASGSSQCPGRWSSLSPIPWLPPISSTRLHKFHEFMLLELFYERLLWLPQMYSADICGVQYLKLVRTLEGYGELSFPHCPCDAKKEGHVVATVGLESFKLQACKEDGVLESVSICCRIFPHSVVTMLLPKNINIMVLLPCECSRSIKAKLAVCCQSQVIEFQWDSMKDWEADDEGMAFTFEYCRPDKKPRCIKIFTPYYVFMYDCFQKVQEERRGGDESGLDPYIIMWLLQ